MDDVQTTALQWRKKNVYNKIKRDNSWRPLEMSTSLIFFWRINFKIYNYYYTFGRLHEDARAVPQEFRGRLPNREKKRQMEVCKI